MGNNLYPVFCSECKTIIGFSKVSLSPVCIICNSCNSNNLRFATFPNMVELARLRKINDQFSEMHKKITKSLSIPIKDAVKAFENFRDQVNLLEDVKKPKDYMKHNKSDWRNKRR